MGIDACLLFPVVLAISFGLGGWLILTSRKPAGRDAPHCVHCDYNLTGLTSDRCPECGQEIVTTTASYEPGTVMNWKRFILGLLALSLPLLIFAVLIRMGMVSRATPAVTSRPSQSIAAPASDGAETNQN